MHVVLVSQSTGRALQRTRSIIDRFAVRFGTDTWMTPITTEALAGLRRDLAQSATREMSVACYRNAGMQKMTLLWTVGSRKTFAEHGGVAVATVSRKKNPMPEYVSTVKTLARLSGLTHDLGKMNTFFQEKLISKKTVKKIRKGEKDKSEYLGDPIRHEWLSGILLNAVWDGTPASLGSAKRNGNLPIDCVKSNIPVSSWAVLDALRWAVITHHHMMKGTIGDPDNSRHWHYQGKPEQGKVLEPFQGAELPEDVLQNIQKYKVVLLEHPLNDWRGAAIIARAALTWADHYWSSQEQRTPDQEVLRANSKSKQSLRVHLLGVGAHAWRIAQAYFEGHDFSGCSPQSMENLLRPAAPDSRFRWQNIAADFLGALPKGEPTLVFNLGGTGSGKTRANMRCLAALSPEDRPFRVTSVFNLRTLTVQTHHAYQQELGIEENDLACMVGDPLVRKLNELQQAVALEDSEEPGAAEETEYQVEAAAGVVPSWLERMRSFRPGLIPLLTPPVLVSTIDYVIAAGDFGDTTHHASALMRIAHSDLVLDEIDGYEPAALAAVCRVVLLSALFGRNIVASSATLSEPVAKALRKAFTQGCVLRAGMIGQTGDTVSPRYVFVDDQVAPSVAGDDNFEAAYHQYVERLVSAVSAGAAHRRYRAIPVGNAEIEDWAVIIDRESARLHADHHFDWEGVRVSVGLVRMANVRPCVQIARILADQHQDGLVVTSYHASDMMLRRAMKEQMLDRALTRKPMAHGDPNQSILEDPEMRQAHARAKAAGVQDLRFVVVATPVEEIGRDHDFDWAILEPSSAQSIVQAAGRVNRHRLMVVDHPNVAVMDRNLRSFRPKNGRSFQYPGYEIDQVSAYKVYDMQQLLCKPDGEVLHAGWRIGSDKTVFAQKDDESIEAFLVDGLKHLDKPWTWHSALFDKYALRVSSGMYAHVFRYDEEDRKMMFIQQGVEEEYALAEFCSVEKNCSAHAFFCPSLEEVTQYAREIDEDETVAQRFHVTMPAKQRPVHFDFLFGGYGKV
ncbi:CRISPR-associated endonuclease Cas3'' [Acidithiobacillus sulfurivorans]|uniref:CRISPR-associated endonuclease Cas3 n=1 Tax=Acidithiobacillus sulfurivorans TaxID=1958756 RepID=A0ABS5ZYI2_9PROT|nr:CRISPR-associated endonuclease Cas3'' [Acidithiobacillus sulfurivorans]MBU2760283.1 CRISPR-associated endonuclease Cas3'' [Acidithiobacillus sulfurivorans]